MRVSTLEAKASTYTDDVTLHGTAKGLRDQRSPFVLLRGVRLTHPGFSVDAYVDSRSLRTNASRATRSRVFAEVTSIGSIWGSMPS